MEYWIQIGKRGYKLRPYSIKMQIQAYKFYKDEINPNGFEVLGKRLSEGDPEVWIEIGYMLLEDKTDFPTYSKFYEAITGGQSDSKEVTVTNELEYVTLVKTVKAAMENAMPKDLVDLPRAKKKSFLLGIGSGICLSVLIYFVIVMVGQMIISTPGLPSN